MKMKRNRNCFGNIRLDWFLPSQKLKLEQFGHLPQKKGFFAKLCFPVLFGAELQIKNLEPSPSKISQSITQIKSTSWVLN